MAGIAGSKTTSIQLMCKMIRQPSLTTYGLSRDAGVPFTLRCIPDMLLLYLVTSCPLRNQWSCHRQANQETQGRQNHKVAMRT